MKVIHLSSSDISGGASIACKRINAALIANGIDSNLLVQKKISFDPRVKSTTNNFLSKLSYYSRFVLDEGYIRLFTNQKRGRFTNPFVGLDISNNPLVQTVDIIHLHWINGGYLSLNSIKKLKQLNKPIVWTLHDMWAFTGGCHYSLECRKFETECNNCPSLKNAGMTDMSNKIFRNKDFFDGINLTVATCSNWLKLEAEKSHLLRNKRIVNIPNTLDTNLYIPTDVRTAREKFSLQKDKIYILFGSMNIIDERKGFKYLLDSMKKLASESDNTNELIEIIIFGKANEKILDSIPFNKHYFGNFKSEEDIISAYNAADIFIAPSLQDNLPNTVLESLSCGTPVVAYNVGGLPDMIDHLNNGYLAEANSVEGLTNGIKWYLNNRTSDDSLKVNARQKVLTNFTQEIVAEKYIELYTSLI